MRFPAHVGTPTALLSSVRRLLLLSRCQRTLSPSVATTTTTTPAAVASRRSVHAEARGGFGGNNASFYERSRPGYPSDALRAIEAEIRRHELHGSGGGGGGGGGGGTSGCGGSTLVDLGCGTGKFTREILPFARSEGLSLVGIEPVEAMRKQFEKALPGVRIVDGIAEDIPLPGSSARALFAAQSFHWMASPATLREVHRVLVPGGLFVMLWNTRDLSRPWVRAVEDIIDPFYGDDVPRQHGGLWRQSFKDLEHQSSEENHEESAGQRHRHRRSFFGELTEHHFRHSQLLTLDELDDRMRSISVIATRPESERASASYRARRLAETHWDTRDELRKSGRVELAYDTEVYWCRKLDAPPPQ